MKSLFTLLIICLISGIGTATAQWQQTNGPEGGNVNCIRQVNSQVWVGTRNGFYISSNNGLSWQKSTLLPDKPVGDFYFEGDTIVILYAGSINSSGDYLDVSTLSSFDGGTSWTNTLMISHANFMFFTLNRYQNGLFYIDEYENAGMVSADMGLTWTESALPSGFINYEFAYDSKRVLLTCMDDSSYAQRLFVSDDMMQSWQDRGDISYGFVWFIRDSLILYNGYSSTTGMYLMYRSTDIGFTWDTVYYSPAAFQLSSFVVIGDSIYDYIFPGYPILSTDNGLTWQTGEFPVYYHYNSLDLANGDIMFYDNGTRNIFRDLNASGDTILSQTGFKGEYIFSVRSCNNVLYASVKDAFCRSDDAGQSWTRVCQLPPYLSHSQIYEVKNTHDTILWINSDYLGISFNNGLSWDTIPLPENSYLEDVSSLGIIGNRVFLSTDKFYYSDNWGQSFDTLPGLPGLYSYEKIGFLEINQNTLFAVNNSGEVYKYDEANMIWNQVFSFWSPGAFNGNTLYSLGNALIVSGRQTFAYSLDNGVTWTTPQNNGLPTSSGSKIYPGRIQLYEGSWIGTVNTSSIYYTSDHGNNWVQLPGAPVDFIPRSLVVQNGVLFTGSYYQSVWRRTGTLMNVSGKVFLDANNNGVMDPGENGIPQISLNTHPGGWMSVTDSLGSYTMITDVNNDTIRPGFTGSFTQINPEYHLASQGAQNQDFGIYCEPGVQDFSIDITNVNIFRPGFKTLLNISVFNKGSVSQSPFVVFYKPYNLTYYSADPQPLSITADSITWQLGNLDFMGQTSIKLAVFTSFTTQIGDTIHCSATVMPVAGDTLPEDNNFYLHQVVQGSFDPNDKTCEQGEYFTPQSIQNGVEMEFTIRFQNMGTLPTEFVRIVDTLSPYLDPSSFKILSASHPFTWTVNNNRVFQFLFDPLSLPPENLNELGSMGYIKYAVKCLPGTSLGSTITNMAYIYFDYNPPVVTNMTSTVVANVIITGVNQINSLGKTTRFVVYPNPSAGVFWVKVLDPFDGYYSVCLMDISGRAVLVSNSASPETRIDLGEIRNGIYFGYLTNSSGAKMGSFKIVVLDR